MEPGCAVRDVKGQVPDNVFELFDTLTQESSFSVKGTVRKDDRAPVVLNWMSSISRKYFRLHWNILLRQKNMAWNFWRTAAISGCAQHGSMRSCACGTGSLKRFATFLTGADSRLVDSPILTPAACEGTSTLFDTDYFDLGKAYLTQSGQLYAEAGAMQWEKCTVSVRHSALKNQRRAAPDGILDGRAGSCL